MGNRKQTVAIGLFVLLLTGSNGLAGTVEDVKRGAYLASIANCAGCHTEDREGAIPYAGGRALKTPFGTFFGPNITPDNDRGIGRWSESDFIRSMRHGVRPDGAIYFPAFPYPSFTGISDSDLKDLWSYLRSLKPDKLASRPHDLGPLFGMRFPLRGWQWLFFTPGPFVPDHVRSGSVDRGAYLVQAVGHCGECHTPRNLAGAPKKKSYLKGGIGPDGKKVPDLTSSRLKKWSDQDLAKYLKTGILPDGDVANKAMEEVVTNATSKLTPADLAAVISYLRTLQ